MADQNMPKIFHDPHKIPFSPLYILNLRSLIGLKKLNNVVDSYVSKDTVFAKVVVKVNVVDIKKTSTSGLVFKSETSRINKVRKKTFITNGLVKKPN